MKHRVQKGQVLIVAIIMALVLLLAVFIFFDVHSAIRAKLKVVTASEAAALAAARNQAETLNMIGEINLLMASEAIVCSSAIPLSDSQMQAEADGNALSEAEKAAARVHTLSEMQTRLSFVGPLVAFAAAQQAAKNNGMANQVDSKRPDRDFTDYYDRLNNPFNRRYFLDGGIPKTANGYYWLENYPKMLRKIAAQGVVVRPNDRTGGLEKVTPSFLMDSVLYTVILSCDSGYNNWCYNSLRDLIKRPDSFFSGLWFRPDFEFVPFPEQSEIYGVDVSLSLASRTVENDELFQDLSQKVSSILPRGTDNHLDRPSFDLTPRWYLFNKYWHTGTGYYNGPNIGANSYWRRGYFLQQDLADNVIHGGALAYAECYTQMGTITELERKSSSKRIGDVANPVALKKTSQTTIGNNFRDNWSRGGTVAKPIGSLNGEVPNALVIVLPVFSRVTLIPTTMQRYRVFTAEKQPLEIFLEWLRDSEITDLNDASSPPSGTNRYLKALRILQDETFRHKGYNPNFTASTLNHLIATNPAALFSEEYKYPNRADGAGWLQQACIRIHYNPPPGGKTDTVYRYTTEIAQALNTETRNMMKQDDHKQNCPAQKSRDNNDCTCCVIYDVPPANEVWYFKNGRFFIVRNGVVFNNENDPYYGCAALQGTSGYGPSGTNTGPSLL